MPLPSLLRALLQRSPSPSTAQEQTMSTATAPAPARDAESMLAKVALECGGDISASQEEVLATSSFLGGDNAFPADASSDDDEEVFATPADATQQQEEDPVVIMCTLPFTPTPSKPSRSPSPPHSNQPHSPAPPLSFDAADADDVPLANPRRKPRVGIRKVRGARISTPTPSPEEQQPQAEQHPEAELHQQSEQQRPVHVDPLVKAVLMIPTKTAAATSTSGNPVEDFLTLCRQKGLI